MPSFRRTPQKCIAGCELTKWVQEYVDISVFVYFACISVCSLSAKFSDNIKNPVLSQYRSIQIDTAHTSSALAAPEECLFHRWCEKIRCLHTDILMKLFKPTTTKNPLNLTLRRHSLLPTNPQHCCHHSLLPLSPIPACCFFLCQHYHIWFTKPTTNCFHYSFHTCLPSFDHPSFSSAASFTSFFFFALRSDNSLYSPHPSILPFPFSEVPLWALCCHWGMTLLGC